MYFRTTYLARFLLGLYHGWANNGHTHEPHTQKVRHAWHWRSHDKIIQRVFPKCMIFGHSFLTRGNVGHSHVMAAVILLRGYISAQWLPKGGTMASASPASVRIWIFGPHLRPTASEIPGVEATTCALISPSGGSDARVWEALAWWLTPRALK